MDQLDQNIPEIAEYAALIEKIAELTKQAEAMRHRALARAAIAVRSIMDEHGLSLEDVENGRKPFSRNPGFPNRQMPVRYREPDSDRTWSGIGRAPKWIADVPDRNVFAV